MSLCHYGEFRSPECRGADDDKVAIDQNLKLRVNFSVLMKMF
jgi:hypothetical protein